MNLAAAQAYHAKHAPQALLVRQGARTLLEHYEGGMSAQKPHALYSGTKSFWGTAAVYAQEDGLLALDDPAWQGATIRQLLNLTAGAPFGGLGSAVPTFEKALATPARDIPGAKFTYGGIPLQIFGAVFSRRLDAIGKTPHQYLNDRVLEPGGVTVDAWRTLKDGTHPLPTGAFLTASHWARYGEYVLRERARLQECFTGSQANPRYGLCWWLAPAGTPEDLFYASGSGGQAMYIIPSHDAIVVRFGSGGSYNHAALLKRLFS